MTSFLKALFFKAPILAQSCQNTLCTKLHCWAENTRHYAVERPWSGRDCSFGGGRCRASLASCRREERAQPPCWNAAVTSHGSGPRSPLTLYCTSERTSQQLTLWIGLFDFVVRFLKTSSCFSFCEILNRTLTPCSLWWSVLLCLWVPWGGVCGILVIKEWRQYFDKMWRLIYTTLYT